METLLVAHPHRIRLTHPKFKQKDSGLSWAQAANRAALARRMAPGTLQPHVRQPWHARAAEAVRDVDNLRRESENGQNVGLKHMSPARQHVLPVHVSGLLQAPREKYQIRLARSPPVCVTASRQLCGVWPLPMSRGDGGKPPQDSSAWQQWRPRVITVNRIRAQEAR